MLLGFRFCGHNTIRIAFIELLLLASPAAAWPSSVHAEMARAARSISAITAHKYPYDVTDRMINECLEANVQQHRDSDAFFLGAHLTAAFWIASLPRDVGHQKTLARHIDIVRWLRPRVDLPNEEIARVVAQAAGLPRGSRGRLLSFLEAPAATPAP